MALSSSPQRIGQMQLGRRFATVPKDQLQILNHDDAWVFNPSDRRGLPPVPEHVVQDMRSRHLMQLQTARKYADRIASSDKDVVSKRHHSGGQVFESSRDEAGEDDDACQVQSQDQASEVGEILTSWSGSPVQEPLQSIPSPETPVFRLRPRPAVAETDLSNADDSSVFYKSLPTPASRQTLHHAVTVGGEEDEDEEEMEVDLPGAHEGSQARVNLDSARVQVASTPAATIVTQIAFETPPCAQPDQQIIPGTILSDQPPVRYREDLKRTNRRRMQPIQFEGTMPVKRVDSFSARRLPTMSRLAEVASPTSTSSTSHISASFPTYSSQDSAANHAAATQIPIAEPASPPRAPHQSCGTASIQNPSMESSSCQGNPSTLMTKDSYSLFKSAYPSYTTAHAGSLKNFVKSILCLEYLQSERALHEFLYDDFIRAFSSAYLTYVRNAGPGQEPLPAIEWFNRLDGPPVFSQMIMTKRNVNAALKEFPEEVSLARRYIGVGPQKRKRSLSRETERPNGGNATTHVDANTCQTREVSAVRPAKYARGTPAPVPSSRPGSDTPQSSRIPPTSSAQLRKTPAASQYFERVKRESKNKSARSASMDQKARLREHFRKATAKKMLCSGDRHVSSRF